MEVMLFELYQMLFIASIIYITYMIGVIGFSAYGRFVLKDEKSKLSITRTERILMWISIVLLFSFLI